MFIGAQMSAASWSTLMCVDRFSEDNQVSEYSEELDCRCPSTWQQGDSKMLGTIAAVLIVLWLLGFFAFHVTTGFIHIVLVVGLVLLVFHFLSGRGAEA